METVNQYTLIEFIFDYYNQALFQGQLKYCFIYLKKKGVIGFISPESINTQKAPAHGSSPNPQDMEWESMEFHINFVHYMLHIWQRDYGNPSRNGYHNTDYTQKSEEVGIITSSTGEPGGKRTGQKVFPYHAPGGLFVKSYNDFPKDEIEYLPLPVMGDPANSSKDNKTTYQCPCCGNKAYGKQNILIVCFVCFELLIPQEGKAGKEFPCENRGSEQAAKKILALLRKEKDRLYRKLSTHLNVTNI